jgi:hypothetical protein
MFVNRIRWDKLEIMTSSSALPQKHFMRIPILGEDQERDRGRIALSASRPANRHAAILFRRPHPVGRGSN